MQLKTILAAMLLPAACAAHASGAAPHWDYAGKNGPDKWGELEHQFAECKLGKEQSPIDIRGAAKAALPALDLQYAAGAAEVVNNGHTIQVNLADGGTFKLDGVPYKLVQFHFHTPSEERIAGKSFPLVAHLVHNSADGKLAVVAVLFNEGKPNAALAPVFDAMPKAADEKKPLAAPFNAAELLPRDRGYYRFMGSLTTPPCSEGVRWQVLKQPVELSKDQLDAFRKLYPMNARPVQPLNGRKVEES